ncbi:MAG TPA: FtsX-like permease family protein [Puia sp.]|nr:FtsX-like permease family protein [Puia sp.]
MQTGSHVVSSGFYYTKYAKKFSDEEQIRTLAGLFAGLTILISCLGLFGLATFMAESRTKEIGVREVLGASVANITALLARDFVRLVIVAVLIASPIAWWAAEKWLNGFTYRTSVSAWIFIGAGMISIGIALFTVSFQSIKAAIANPVKSLRVD